MQVWYILKCYVPIQNNPVCYIPTSLHPHMYHPWTAGFVLSLKRHSVTESVFVLSLNLLIAWTFDPCFFQIYFNPLTQFHWFLTVLEYSLTSGKYPLTTAPCTLYNVKKKIKNLFRLWHFFLTVHFYFFRDFHHKPMDWLDILPNLT